MKPTVAKLYTLIDDMVARLEDIEADRQCVPHKILIVPVGPEHKVGLWKEEITEKNRQLFIACMEQIPGIDTGLSYVAMSGLHGFHLEQNASLMAQAIGKAFGLWQLFPIDKCSYPEACEHHHNDTQGYLPINTGLEITEDWYDRLYGGDINQVHNTMG